MGVLGRERCFIVHQANVNLKVPNDLAGIATAKYNWPRVDNNHSAAVGTACDAIRKLIMSLGINKRKVEKKLEGVESEQLLQRQNVDVVSFIISYFLLIYKINHLCNWGVKLKQSSAVHIQAFVSVDEFCCGVMVECQERASSIS